MFDIASLWLVILAGAGAAYIGSFIAWMVLPHHRSDCKPLPDEASALAALGEQNLTPGLYNLPHCKTFEDMKKPEFVERINRGPVGFLTVIPSGMPKMGPMMLKQVIFFLVSTALIAYVVSLTITASSDYLSVFRATSAIAFLTYGFGLIPDGIWYGRPWSVIVKHLFDALFYALLTAGIFGWLWPLA